MPTPKRKRKPKAVPVPVPGFEIEVDPDSEYQPDEGFDLDRYLDRSFGEAAAVAGVELSRADMANIFDDLAALGIDLETL